MMVYVTVGGMVATTWVQIIKACLLLFGGTLVLILGFSQFGFSLTTLLEKAQAVHKQGASLMAPGSLLSDPVTALSLGLGLMFGTAGLPHILMRFFTVGNAKEARKSVLYASGFVGFFFNVIFLMGLVAILLVGQNPEYFEGGDIKGALIGGGNMVAMHLAHAVGGNMLLGFLAAVAFATILAVVSGLALAGASAIAHDIYARVIRKGECTDKEEIKVSRMATIALGILAHHPRYRLRKAEHRLHGRSGFRRRCRSQLPGPDSLDVLERADHSRRTVGGYGGVISAVLFVVFSKAVWVDVLHNAAPLFPYTQPALFAMPIAFFLAYVFSVSDSSARAAKERDAFEDQYVRAQTGFGASGASH
jgi:cation/acetate symporter